MAAIYTHSDVRFVLYEPGARKANKYYLARLSWPGGRTEISTGRTVEEEAIEHVHLFIAEIAGLTERSRRTQPQGVALGEFELWLLKTYRLEHESVLRPDGREVLFYKVAGGYMATRIAYGPFIKSVLEHRLKFLLAYRWLPASIDHVNRVRHDNRLDNLRPATPAQQTANRRKARENPGEKL